MFKNYIMVALRSIGRQKMYSALNISGLAIGMAACLLIALYVQYELSFDRYHENTDRIYRVVRDGRVLTPAPLGPALKQNFTDVNAVARIIKDSNTLVSHADRHFLEDEFYWVGPDIFRIFTLPFVEGNPETALREPYSIVISQSTARKYFAGQSPLGKTLNINDGMDFKVTGVFEDMPGNSHFLMDLVVPYEDYFRVSNNDSNNWRANFTYTYFLLEEGSDPATLEKDIHRVVEAPLMEKFGVPKPYPEIYFVQPLTEIHLESHSQQEISVNNNMLYIVLFSSIALLILLIACINYVNLATARSTRRGREVGMRKVVGAKRSQLVQQFMGESVFLILLALCLTFLIINLVLPAFNNLVERQLSMSAMLQPQFMMLLAMTVVVVSLLAGSYPAISISGFKPVQTLKGEFSRGKRGQKLRNMLVLFQFSVTIVLFVCTMTIKGQLDFVNSYDVGYDKDNIVSLTIRDVEVRRNIEAIKTELLQTPGVLAVATSARLPNDIDTFSTRALNSALPDQETTIFYNSAGYDFIDLYGIEIVQGRNFSRDQASDAQGVFLVNETAVKAAGWASPLEQTMTHWSGTTGQIVGVMKDFHLRSLHSPVDPLYVVLAPKTFSHISVKIEPDDVSNTLAGMEVVMKKFSPNFPFEYAFFDQQFAQAYHPEQRMVNIFSSFAFLAIIVACLGLFGLSAFTAQQRTKEIGIRKIMGASVSGITLLLSREFVRWVVLANLIAWPVAWLAMEKWLQNFALRTDQNAVYFVLASTIAFIVAVATVAILSIRAAMANPSKALRYE